MSVRLSSSLEAAVRAMLAEPSPVPPADRLARAAADGARTQAKGKPVEERTKAIDTAVKETVFRFRLVLRIITVTCDLLDRQLLLDGVFALQLDPRRSQSWRAARWALDD